MVYAGVFVPGLHGNPTYRNVNIFIAPILLRGMEKMSSQIKDYSSGLCLVFFGQLFVVLLGLFRPIRHLRSHCFGGLGGGWPFIGCCVWFCAEPDYFLFPLADHEQKSASRDIYASIYKRLVFYLLF